MNKKTIVAIFAHPDDEAFGPGGTLAILAQNHDVHIICVTQGDAGHNGTKDTRTLSDIRAEELQNAAKMLGIQQVHFLNYKDGTLCNNEYHTIAVELTKLVHKLNPSILITYEPRGVSGHLDHIAVSMITSFIFERNCNAEELWYFCLSDEMAAEISKRQKPYFVYSPPGYPLAQIDKTFDISPVLDLKLAAMKQHISQWKDENTLSSILKKFPHEHFIVKTQSC